MPTTSGIKINFKAYVFQAQWKFILLTLLFLTLFSFLGCWQLQRAHYKRELELDFANQRQTAPLNLSQVIVQPEHFKYYPFQVSGYFDNAHTILLENKYHDHQLGYEVLTPMTIPGEKSQILINRGWIVASLRRNILPQFPPVNGLQTLVGQVYVPEKAFILGSTFDQTQNWPLRAQAIRLEDFSQVLHTPLLPFMLLLNPQQPNGFIRDWHPVTMPAYKHTGYAVQWFSFALVLIIIFLIRHTKKSR
jgi:surfeit locus 1 family protein